MSEITTLERTNYAGDDRPKINTNFSNLNTDKLEKSLLLPSHIIYVDNNRTDAYTPDGSLVMPYKTIQAAVNAIAALDLAYYVNIKIASGIYAENIVLEDLSLNYLCLEGDGYVSINPASGKAIQSEANNTNIFALYLTNIISAKPISIIGTNGSTNFSDVIFTRVNLTGAVTSTFKCMNNVTWKESYIEQALAYENINWSWINGTQIQGNISFEMDSAKDLPSAGADGVVMYTGGVFSGTPSFVIGGTATYTVAIECNRFGNGAVTIPAGVTVYNYAGIMKGTWTNNGALHLRGGFPQAYVAGTGTLNLDYQPASFIKNDSVNVTGTTVADALDTLYGLINPA